MSNDTLTSIDGIRVGHAEHPRAPTGCTVVIPDGGAVAGVDVRGGAPGTYGTDTLHPVNLVDRVQAVFLTGGSAHGLAVAEGIRQYLVERGEGFETGYGIVPIVAGAVIFDLGLNPEKNFPDAALGYQACRSATPEPVVQGSVGAGKGATVGKLLGLDHAMRGGLGSSVINAPSGLQVGALVVVNAFGDVIDPASGDIVAGCRVSPKDPQPADARVQLLQHLTLRGFANGTNTVIGVVATNARLTKTGCTKVAQMAQDGLARTIVPAHTMVDGDTLFALSLGKMDGVDVSVVGALAAETVADAVLRAVTRASAWSSIPSAEDLNPGIHS